MPMPVSTVKLKGLERCREAARASTMAAHASAQLSLPWHKEAARLLRVAESVSRTAAALLDAAAYELRAPHLPPAAAAGGPVPAKPSRSARRRALKRGSPQDSVMGSVAVDATPGGNADSGPVPGPVCSLDALAAAPSPRELRQRTSRERSPRRPLPHDAPGQVLEGEHMHEAVLPLPLGASGPVFGSVRHSKPDDFVAGTVMMVRGLVKRPELENTRCRLLSLNGATGRWAIVLEDTDNRIQVLPTNLFKCLFPQDFRSASGT